MRKFIWAIIIVLFLGGGIYLATNSSNVLVTSKSGSITEKKYMSSVTKTSAGKNALISMVTNQSLNRLYGNKVPSSKVQSAYNQERAQYGSQWNSLLSQQRLTNKKFLKQLKTQMLLTEAAKDHHKIKESQLKNAYKNFAPEMKVSVIKTSNKQKINQALNDLKKGANFQNEVRKKSDDKYLISKNGNLPEFNSTSQFTSSSVIQAAKKLKVGSYTQKPVRENSNYLIIKLNSRNKKEGLNNYRNVLSDQLANKWLNSSGSSKRVQSLIGKVLNKNDVKIKTDDYPQLKNALNQYLLNNTSKKTSSVSGNQ